MPKYISGLSADSVSPEGDYDYNVEEAKLRTSKKGSEMIELSLSIGQNGHRITDYLVFGGALLSSAHIDQFRTSIGEVILPGEEVEINPSELIGKTGRVHIVVEEWNKQKRNKVGSYLEPEELPGLEPVKPAKPAKKTDKPF